MTPDEEATGGKRHAYGELARAQRSLTRTEAIIDDVRESMDRMRARTERNHFAESMRNTIRRKAEQ